MAADHPQGDRLLRAVGFADEVDPDEWQEAAEIGQRFLVASDGLIKSLGEKALRARIGADCSPH